ncbi:small cell adhesion glycoprotein [Callithrix jacchus]|uniref:Small cell adhesion glycoprotein n=2 Tax=Callithrix jacchus TaxID=9483 RepID=A0A8I3WVC3_CALJA|nr:small cell adhesion glycoprotein [Callithrix jacchus]XP_017831554.1 small cell adhesion glycoprotein [Callithrix jacchus]
MEGKVTIGEEQAAFPPKGAEGTCRGRILSTFPVPPRRPAPHPLRPLRQPRAPPRLPPLGVLGRPPPASAAPRCPPPSTSKGRAERRRPFAGSPSDWKDLPLLQGTQPLVTMTSLLTTPSPRELMTTPILRPTEALSPEDGASTALIAVVITVVFLILLSVVILIFFYLYKNKGSYVTYEPTEGEPSAVVQMESDLVKSREKEEYFI